MRLDGPPARPLVFFPGLTDAVLQPREVAERYRRNFAPWAQRRCIYFVSRRRPLPGGWTATRMARDYAEAIDDIRGREGLVPDAPVDVTGASVGGCIALQLAISHPELVHRLVIQEAACRIDRSAEAVARRWAQWVETERYLRFTYSVVHHTFSGFRRALHDGLVAGAARRIRRSGADWGTDVVQTLLAIGHFDVTDKLEQISAETLIIGGERDQLFDPRLLRLTAERLPKGRLVLLRGAGHAAQMERRRAYDRAVLSFLDAPDAIDRGFH